MLGEREGECMNPYITCAIKHLNYNSPFRAESGEMFRLTLMGGACATAIHVIKQTD